MLFGLLTSMFRMFKKLFGMVNDDFKWDRRPMFSTQLNKTAAHPAPLCLALPIPPNKVRQVGATEIRTEWSRDAEGNYIYGPRRPGGIERPPRSCVPAGRATITADCAHRKGFFCKRVAFRCSGLLSYSEL